MFSFYNPSKILFLSLLVFSTMLGRRRARADSTGGLRRREFARWLANEKVVMLGTDPVSRSGPVRVI